MVACIVRVPCCGKWTSAGAKAEYASETHREQLRNYSPFIRSPSFPWNRCHAHFFHTYYIFRVCEKGWTPNVYKSLGRSHRLLAILKLCP
jgi:hypothetical protein